MLTRGINLLGYLIASHDLVRLRQVVHCEVDAIQVSARNLEVSRKHCTGCDQNSVISLLKFVPGDIDTNIHGSAETSSLSLHLCDAAVDVVLFHLEIRDAIAKQSANAVVSFVNRNGVACSSQLLGSS